MTSLPRLTTLLPIGVVILLFAGGAVGARTLGLAPGEAPAPVVQAIPAVAADATTDTTAENQPGTPPLDPAAAPAAIAQPAASAPLATAPGGRVAVSTNRPILGKPSDAATITAVVTDPAGTPLAGVPVTFSLDDAEVGQLTVANTVTDASGAAMTSFVPEVFRGRATVTAAAGEGTSGQVTIRIDCGC